MANSAKVSTDPQIGKTPDVCGGQPTIGDTRVRVKNIVALLKEGKTPEQMLVEYPSLSLGQVRSAIAYYYDNPDEIEAALKEEEDWAARHEQLRSEHMARGSGE